MFVTVTPNLALDITYTLDRLEIGTPMRVPDMRERAGGKGVNVARILDQLGVQACAVALCGGNNGRTVAAELSIAGLAHRLVPIAGETRRAIAVVERDTGSTTVFNERGPAITAPEWQELEAAVAAVLGEADVLVISGSLPPGAAPDGHARLVNASRQAGVPVIVDATGEALLLAARAEPEIVKPNQSELLEATGETDVASGARVLLDLGAQAVVVSLGPEGALAVTEAGTWTARPPGPIVGNATGAGDAMVAALAVGMARGWSWPLMMAEAVALSAAAVAHPQAGSFDQATYSAIREALRGHQPQPSVAVTR